MSSREEDTQSRGMPSRAEECQAEQRCKAEMSKMQDAEDAGCRGSP